MYEELYFSKNFWYSFLSVPEAYLQKEIEW